MTATERVRLVENPGKLQEIVNAAGNQWAPILPVQVGSRSRANFTGVAHCDSLRPTVGRYFTSDVWCLEMCGLWTVDHDGLSTC